MTWQPIETAPERTYVLAFQRGAKPEFFVAIRDEDDGGWFVDTQTSWDDVEPEYWQPLPPRPEND